MQITHNAVICLHSFNTILKYFPTSLVQFNNASDSIISVVELSCLLLSETFDELYKLLILTYVKRISMERIDNYTDGSTVSKKRL